MGTKEQSENADQSGNILKSILGVARRINKQDDCAKMIDTRYFTELSNCLPYGPLDILCLRRSAIDCVNTVIRNWLSDTQKLMINYGFKMKRLGEFFEGSI